MSNYVEQNLMPNEQIIAVGKVHWHIYITGALLIFIGLIFVSSTEVLGWPMLIVGIFLLIRAWLTVISTELAVTNKRVIAKFGFIRRSTIELLHDKVESFHVDQGVAGRIFNYGTLVVNGTGGIRTPIPSVAAPLDFRRQALIAIENGQTGSNNK